MKKLDQYMNDSKSYIGNSFFWKYLAISGIQHFYIYQHVSVDIIRVFTLILGFLTKILKANKKQYSFTQKVSFILWTSTHLTLKIICHQNTAKSLPDFTNFQISWHSKNAFLKHFESKFLYISVYLRLKIFVPKT